MTVSARLQLAKRLALTSVLLLYGCGGLVSSDNGPGVVPTQAPERVPASQSSVVEVLPGGEFEVAEAEQGRSLPDPVMSSPVETSPPRKGLPVDAGVAQPASAPEAGRQPMVQCVREEVRCNGANAEICSLDGTSWELRETCPTAALCDPEFGRCIPGGPVPGTMLCNGALLLRANEERTGFEVVATCASECLCNAEFGGCAQPTCAPGETRCAGASLQECNDCQTGFDVRSVCDSPVFCDADAGQCVGEASVTFDADAAIDAAP